ncbi:MAG: lipid II:glycine glycyltransferase FemX [Anaerolineaceae bacterium]
MDFEITNSLNDEVWRSFIKDQPSGNIFQTPEMFEVFRRTQGYRPQLFAAINNEGQLLALMTPIQVTLHNGLLRRLMTRSIAYGGALYVHDENGKVALGDLLRECTRKTKRDAIFTELRNLSDVNTIKDTLSDCGYDYEEHLNYLIDISSSPEQVMQNIGSRTRKNIRHGLRKGNVIVELVEDLSQLDGWYNLVKKSYTAARVPLADISLFKSAFEVLTPKGMARFYLARIGNKNVAATVELPYKNVIYGWYSGVDRDFASEYPGELLMWEILRWGSENGYRVYDFGGAGKPDEQSGVRDFKAKFGGQLVCYGRNIKIHSPQLLHVSKWGYEFYRKLIKFKSF